MFRNTSAIGVDIGKSQLNVAVVNSSGLVLVKKSCRLKTEMSRDYLLTKVISGIKTVRESAAVSGVNPICIGLSLRGFVDHTLGVVIGPDHGIKGWEDVPVARILNRETGLPVYADNDANLMTLAEYWFGSAKNYRNIIFIALRSNGIGGGIIINGQLYRGVNNAGAEIGQMIIDFKNGLSDLGIRGSFEHLACGEALVRSYIKLKKTGNDRVMIIPTALHIFKSAFRGDKTAMEAVSENAKLVGIGAANLISIFAPEIVIIGGGLAQAGEKYIDLIRNSAFINSLEKSRINLKIEKALLGSDASLLGSAYYSMLRLAGKSV